VPAGVIKRSQIAVQVAGGHQRHSDDGDGNFVAGETVLVD
jgi:hypothetical protein